MRILELPDIFRTPSPHIYPPFKNGRYMEEYFYDFIVKNINNLENNINYTYIPVFWTNLQVSDGFDSRKNMYNNLLKEAYNTNNKDTLYFTIVQHDDCILLDLPENTIIFGACSGHIPLPLIYEDTNNLLKNIITTNKFDQTILCSFVGSETCTLRESLKSLTQSPGFIIQTKGWNVNVNINDINNFIGLTVRSIFCLAPRGYGRNSFRFYEAIQLGSIPIYIYDDHNWLPYKDSIDYSTFSIVIHEHDIDKLPSILKSITNDKIIEMQKTLLDVQHFFTLDYMCEYILHTLEHINKYKQTYMELIPGKQTMSLI